MCHLIFCIFQWPGKSFGFEVRVFSGASGLGVGGGFGFRVEGLRDFRAYRGFRVEGF